MNSEVYIKYLKDRNSINYKYYEKYWRNNIITIATPNLENAHKKATENLKCDKQNLKRKVEQLQHQIEYRKIEKKVNKATNKFVNNDNESKILYGMLGFNSK